MTADSYCYIYSAVTQSVSGLIALIGVFTIFKIQIHRFRLDGYYNELKNLVGSNYSYHSPEHLDQEANAILKRPRNTAITPICNKVEAITVLISREKNQFDYTRKAGIKAIWLSGILFCYYLICLNLNYWLHKYSWRNLPLALGIFFALAVIIVDIFYIKRCLERDVVKY